MLGLADTLMGVVGAGGFVLFESKACPSLGLGWAVQQHYLLMSVSFSSPSSGCTMPAWFAPKLSFSILCEKL